MLISFLSENYRRAKDRCLKMMDRLDLYGSFNRLDRDVIFNKLAMWTLKNLRSINLKRLSYLKIHIHTPHT